MVKIKRGRRYLHNKWLDGDSKRPAVVIPTKLFLGEVWYRFEYESKARFHTSLKRAQETWREAAREGRDANE